MSADESAQEKLKLLCEEREREREEGEWKTNGGYEGYEGEWKCWMTTFKEEVWKRVKIMTGLR